MGQLSARRSPARPDRSKRIVVAILIFLVLFLAALDYIGWLKGQRSFVFPLFLGRHAAPDLTQSYKIITRELEANRVKKSAVSGFVDAKGVFHIKVDLTLGRYKALAGQLESALRESGARILSQQASQEGETVFYLWTIEGRRKERLALLFACAPGARPKPGGPAAPDRKTPPPPPMAALIMDDMGNSVEAAREVCGLGLPVTVSVLPFSLHATEAAQLAHECGLEVILHLPMESLNNHRTEEDTPGLVTSAMSPAEIRRTTESCLESVPYIRGVNNHMGSKLTEEREPLSRVFEVLKERNLYFIDSRTSANSIALDLARTMGLPAAGSRLFLDPGEDPAAIEAADVKARFLELVRIARKEGRAIGIAHPRRVTFDAIRECLPLAPADKVTFVFASRLAGRG